MFFVGLIVALTFLMLVSLSVFGGGQVFMPIFRWLWLFLASNFGANINDDKINTVFTVSNSTPGVVSTKFGFFTGYLIANGQWWGYIAMFITYLVFCLPAIIVMVLAMKYIKKFKANTIIKNMLIVMRPIIAGIVLSLALQLFLSIFIPEINFNKSVSEYATLNHSTNFFIGYRNVLLKIYVPIGIGISYYLTKKKLSLFLIIIINIMLSFFLFAIPFA
ncbi:chromate transporter [Mycoplasmopsis mustelae]|uniref:Chromate transporter n=1 Tax=Mycoplasmopsis mustelae TaxID=171289 RepID=A0A4R7UCU0_9BACT|nr:chromate transporter [Mycoplasmopsis mustelae]TDV24258.1 chromate transporter [Mycoplasmopsis mustelae]